jgi:hypothetical protein
LTPALQARTGVHVQLLVGPGLPRPAPLDITAALQRIEVVTATDAPGAFQITFKAGRGDPAGRADHSLLRSSLLAPWSRVVVTVQAGARITVLLDGVVTHRQLTAASRSGASVMAVTGEDLTVLMDLEERIASYPAMGEAAIATMVAGRYARYGVQPRIVPPAIIDQPLPTERVPVQHGTDLAHLRTMAARFDYVFALLPGPLPLATTAYWGPAAALLAPPLPALSVATASSGDVESINFSQDPLTPARISGHAIDALTGRPVPVVALPSPLSPLAAWTEPATRVLLPTGLGGLNAPVATGRAQATADRSAEQAASAEGELDTARYGGILAPHRGVGVRGAGATFDGIYRVQRVTHTIERGRYRQRFRLVRPGTGTTTPAVPTGGLAGTAGG